MSSKHKKYPLPIIIGFALIVMFVVCSYIFALTTLLAQFVEMTKFVDLMRLHIR